METTCFDECLNRFKKCETAPTLTTILHVWFPEKPPDQFCPDTRHAPYSAGIRSPGSDTSNNSELNTGMSANIWQKFAICILHWHSLRMQLVVTFKRTGRLSQPHTIGDSTSIRFGPVYDTNKKYISNNILHKKIKKKLQKLFEIYGDRWIIWN